MLTVSKLFKTYQSKNAKELLYGDFQPGLKFQLGIPSLNLISAKQETRF